MRTMILGINLRKLRLRKGLSQQQVADHLGINQTTYCGWESGKTQPKAKYFPAIAALFDLSYNSLFEQLCNEGTANVVGKPGIQVPVVKYISTEHREEVVAGLRELQKAIEEMINQLRQQQP